MSSKVYPSEIKVREAPVSDKFIQWTVWKKSSMSFAGSDGFSVYDIEGRLTFRIDNYSRRSKYLLGELLLMDSIGKPLISLRPQLLSIYSQWKGYSGDGGNNSKPTSNSLLFTMKRNSFSQSKHDAVEVFMKGGGGGMIPDFRIEGCFKKRCCKIHGREGEVLAVISPKKGSPSVVLGEDVFSLSLKEGEELSAEQTTAFIIVLDRIC